MAWRRVLYVLALAAVLLFQITNDNYLAHFLLGLCVGLPALSLLLSLAGMARCRLSLAAVPYRLERGERGKWVLTVDSPTGLPLPRITLLLTQRNLFTGRTQSRRLTLSGVARRQPVERPVNADQCGVLELSAQRVRVLDYLGLFCLRRAAPDSARLLVFPVPEDPDVPLRVPEGAGARPSPDSAARRGPGDDFDLRDYRPGDPLRAVHWKLSTKWDSLIVRERADTLAPLPVLTFDRFGAPERMERTLDRLLGASRSLLALQRPHAVLWLDEKKRPVFRFVSDEKELEECMLAVLSSPLPPSGSSLERFSELASAAGGPVCRFHITPGEERTHV